ncbi:hypothetical protein [Streptomyces sp. NPDC006012]|uniref:hypothetical protein n=1 Tax=Streptomyces sp. NPDC006012 TaxID=3364739 RepID=UPI00368F7343
MTLAGLPGNLLKPVPDTANRSPTYAGTEMLWKLDVEFRGNSLPDEIYSRLVRNGVVMHMENMCSPGPDDVKNVAARRAVEVAAGVGGVGVERVKWTAASACAPSAVRRCCPWRMHRR